MGNCYNVSFSQNGAINKLKTKEDIYKLLTDEQIKEFDEFFDDLYVSDGFLLLGDETRTNGDSASFIPIISAIAKHERREIEVHFSDTLDNDYWGYKADSNGIVYELVIERTWKKLEHQPGDEQIEIQ